ncbi:MAG: Rpn family recombination-promoting nuclease/putative transposase [Clostridia bacterium]|nr:Rpn family recombination-promoting nuclease/putative transposase [Clostridia bacterium]
MIYFSYNDFMDCTENGEANKIAKVEEKIAKYEISNIKKVQKKQNQIIRILSEKTQLKKFLKEFFNLLEIEDINYCNNIKCISDKEINNNIICKVKDKEMFIFIKVIENIDNNISYKMFEHSLNIIKKWNVEEKFKNKRYPIVIPIVIYIGKEMWQKNNIRKYNKINYITYENNKINFSYNMININDLKINELENMESKVAKEIINFKNKYLQIN